MSDQTSQPQQLGDLLKQYKKPAVNPSIGHEHQDFGLNLAHELGDPKRKSLYIKMARDKDRAILERALAFVSDASAKNPAGLFMWKVKQLENEKEKREVT